MGKVTKIQWCDHTFNPWWGCAKVPGDPACHNCYAETFSRRFGLRIWGQAKDRKFMSDMHWRHPLSWDAQAKRNGVRARVFCASMADVFEPRSDLAAARHRLFRLIDDTPNLRWLLLTKRPEYAENPRGARNVWIGATAVTQFHYDSRVTHLRNQSAPVEFVSVEPMLGPIDLRLDLVPEIRWVIAGGESGPWARPMKPDWIRSLRDQCERGGVPFFFKQWGGRNREDPPLLDGRAHQAFPVDPLPAPLGVE